MSTGTKIVLVLVGFIVLYFIFDALKKRKDAEEKAKEEEKPACKELKHDPYYTLKKAKKDKIFVEIQQNGVPNDRYLETWQAYVNQYRTLALENGVQNDPTAILEWLSWYFAQKEMDEDGYCYQAV